MWISETRESYDTVAEGYAEILRDALAGAPAQRGILKLFAELVGDGPVVDAGCGTGRITHYLRGLGVDVSGIDLSPGMIAVAEREYPGCAFRVGSMTDLPYADASLAGLLAWWSLIHVPDDEMPGVFAQFRRVLRPGGTLLVAFNLGTGKTLKTEGYGGHPMRVSVYRRTPEQVAASLRRAGFTLDLDLRLEPDDPQPGAVLIARRPADDTEVVAAGEEPDTAELIGRLLDEGAAVGAAAFLASAGDGLKVPGLYSWWVDPAGAADLSRGLGEPVGAGLIYAGLAGATRWPSGARSRNTLWSRIAGMHLGGNHEFSTFRRTLGAVLATAAGVDRIDEAALTTWMTAHLRVRTVRYDDPDTLGRLEELVLAEIDPPLNLQGRPKTPLRVRLSALRRAFRTP